MYQLAKGADELHPVPGIVYEMEGRLKKEKKVGSAGVGMLSGKPFAKEILAVRLSDRQMGDEELICRRNLRDHSIGYYCLLVTIKSGSLDKSTCTCSLFKTLVAIPCMLNVRVRSDERMSGFH